MKRMLFLLAGAMIFALPCFLGAESQTSILFLFQKKFDFGGRIDMPTSMFVDSKNNIIVGGLQSLPLGSSDGVRPAITKMDSQGSFVWTDVDSTKSAASASNQITGTENGSIFLGFNSDSKRIYRVKGLDSQRNIIWIKDFTGYAYLTTYGDTVIAVVSEQSKTVCYFLNSENGSIFREFTIAIRLNRVAPKIYKNFLYFKGDDVLAGGQTIGKISLDDGKLIWKVNFPYMVMSDCAVDDSGNSCIAGSVVVFLDHITPGKSTIILTHFLARLTANGDTLWKRQWVSRESEDLNQENATYVVAISPKGKIVVGGAIQKGNIHDGPKTAYVKMFSPDGDSLWEKRWDYPETEPISLSLVRDLAFDRNGYLLVMGNSYRNSVGNPPNVCYIDKYSVDGTLGVPNSEQYSPADFSLSQNYPNPFNPTTHIRFEVPKESFVKLAVFDLLGREIKILVQEVKSAGVYEAEFNASGLPSGTYLYRFQNEGFVQTKKMILIK